MKAYTAEEFEGPEELVEDILEWGVLVYEIGNPGASKTYVTIDMIARLTRGKARGDLLGIPANVLYISTEGGFKRSIGPRFLAANGDWSKFHIIERAIPLPGKRNAGLTELRRLITQHKACLVVLDPIGYFLDAVVYSTKDATTRELGKLAKLAADTKCTILCVDWPSATRKKGQLRVSGNQAFTGVPRQVVVVGRLSLEEWVIGVGKVNDSNSELRGWIYTLESKDIGKNRRGKEQHVATIAWKRLAEPGEVQKALDQAQFDQDPNLQELLQLMSDSTWFETKYLLDYLTARRVIGVNKARNTINAGRSAGYIETSAELADVDDGTDAKGDPKTKKKWSVTHRITALGTLRLNMNEEMSEAAVEMLWPSMDDARERTLALPVGNPDNEETS